MSIFDWLIVKSVLLLANQNAQGNQFFEISFASVHQKLTSFPSFVYHLSFWYNKLSFNPFNMQSTVDIFRDEHPKGNFASGHAPHTIKVHLFCDAY